MSTKLRTPDFCLFARYFLNKPRRAVSIKGDNWTTLWDFVLEGIDLTASSSSSITSSGCSVSGETASSSSSITSPGCSILTETAGVLSSSSSTSFSSQIASLACFFSRDYFYF